MSDVSAKTQEGADARAKAMREVLATVEGLLIKLYARWQDEREYEDFEDYAKVLQEICPVEFIRATRRPFGMIMKPEGFPFAVQVFVTSTSFGWKPLQ